MTTISHEMTFRESIQALYKKVWEAAVYFSRILPHQPNYLRLLGGPSNSFSFSPKKKGLPHLGRSFEFFTEFHSNSRRDPGSTVILSVDILIEL